MQRSGPMNGPRFGEASQGALAGAVVGAIGGLFAVGLAAAMVGRDIQLLFRFPLLSLISWVICLPLGWLIGGQTGPRLGRRWNSPKLEVIAGGLGGLIPVIAIALWGWYMVTH